VQSAKHQFYTTTAKVSSDIAQYPGECSVHVLLYLPI